MTAIEVGVLVAVIVAALIQYGQNPAHAFSWRWLDLGEFTTALFATGALTALYFFWYWDITLDLNEVARDASSGLKPETSSSPR